MQLVAPSRTASRKTGGQPDSGAQSGSAVTSEQEAGADRLSTTSVNNVCQRRLSTACVNDVRQ